MAISRKRVCLLTGAGGTLGAAFCRRFANRYHIAAVYRNRPPTVPSQRRWITDPLDGQRALPANTHPVFEMQADLTNDGEIDRIVDVTLGRFDRIDVIVNAAGVALDAPLLDANRFQSALEQQLLVNTILPMRLAANVSLKFWRDRRANNLRANRNVVNVSSVSGLFVYPTPNRAAYGATKAAMNFLSCHMATEYRRFGVRVNVVAPTTFPGRIPTRRVTGAIAMLDRGAMTGRIMVLDAKGRHFA